LGNDYQVLRILDRTINEFEAKCAAADRADWPWWKEMQWWNDAQPKGRNSRLRETKPDVAAIISLLRNVVLMYREYLRLFTLEHGSKDPPRGLKSKDFWGRPFAVHIGRIIECVHCFDTIRQTIDAPDQRSFATAGTVGGYPSYLPNGKGSIRTVRADWLGQALYGIRNSAAHFDPNELSGLTKENVQALLRVLLVWLSTTPSRKAPPGSFQVGQRPVKPVYPWVEDFFIGVDSEPELVTAHFTLFDGSVMPGELPRKVRT
jgi:hypothetical protein